MINRWLVYVNEYPTSQTKEKMNDEFQNYVLNQQIPVTPRNHRKVYLDAHPEDILTQNDHIHHINGNHDDNRIENLMKVDSKTHRLLHSFMASVK